MDTAELATHLETACCTIDIFMYETVVVVSSVWHVQLL